MHDTPIGVSHERLRRVQLLLLLLVLKCLSKYGKHGTALSSQAPSALAPPTAAFLNDSRCGIFGEKACPTGPSQPSTICTYFLYEQIN